MGVPAERRSEGDGGTEMERGTSNMLLLRPCSANSGEPGADEGAVGLPCRNCWALLPLVELPHGAVPVRPALLARHLQVAGSVPARTCSRHGRLQEGEESPRGGQRLLLGKGLVVFWEGQVLAGALGEEGLLRGAG